MEVPLFTQGFLFPFLKYSQAKTPFASVTCHKPEVFMLTGTFLVGKETKYKGAEEQVYGLIARLSSLRIQISTSALKKSKRNSEDWLLSFS